MSARGWDRLVALALALVTVTWLLAVEGREGIGRDESQYFRAGERYWGWFEELGTNLAHGRPGASFSDEGIERYWGDNPEHPVIMKTLYGLSWRAFHRCTCPGPARGLHPLPVRGRHVTLPLFARESTAFRFPAILFAGLLAALVYGFARRWLGRAASAAAAGLAIAQPHYFFHAPIACFDAPITTMAVAVGFAYWKSLRSPRWGWLCGLIFGIALGVKHNAWLMPVFLAGHYLWMRRGDLRRRRLPRVPLAFVAMATLGPIVFFAHWPRLWHHPFQRTGAYVARHMDHEHYNFEYLDRNWNLPPKDAPRRLLRATFPFVSAAFTVPVTTLALAVAGALVLARRRRRPLSPPEPPDDQPSWRRPGADVDLAPGAFLAVQILGPMAVIAVPSTPIFGGVKHFLPAMPFLAVLAGFGLDALMTALREAYAASRPRLARALPAALAALVVLPAVVETRRSHPDGLSHYNMLAGGFAGGASLGMNRQFWGYSVAPMLPWMVETARTHPAVYWHDVLPDAISMYEREGRLPLGIANTGDGIEAIERSNMGIVIHERHMELFEAAFWDSYGTGRPAFVREREGVPLVVGYTREHR